MAAEYEAPALRLARGLALLDAARPGWADAIDLDTLEMWDAYRCVLGQLYGNFRAGYLALNLGITGVSPHGFGLPTDYWRPEIEARRTP